MSKLQNLEDSVNKGILNLTDGLKNKASNLTPSKIKSTIENSKKLKEDKKELLQERVQQAKVKAITSFAHSKEKALELKAKSVETIGKAKEVDVKSINRQKVMLALITLFAPLLTKVKAWYLTLKPSSIATFISISTIATLTSVNIYVQTNKIQDEASRTPASELVEEVDNATAISRRPAYFKKGEKQFKVTNIVLPAYLQNSGPLKKLVIDFTFESSNKYIKQYLWQNPHLVQDVLNSNIEPISIDFPLQDEGKSIVKDKIKKEINSLLKSLKIKGEIEEVYIHSMIGG